MSGHIIQRTVNDTANKKIDLSSLSDDIQNDPLIVSSGMTFDGIVVDGDPSLPASLCSIRFSEGDIPSVQEIAAIDVILTAHTGTPKKRSRFIAGVCVEPGELSITQDTTWQVVGGSTTRTERWVKDLSKLMGQVTGVAKVVESGGGDKPQIRIRERLKRGKSPVVLVMTTLDDTSDDWVSFKADTDTDPREGKNQFTIEARLNGAVSLDLRYVNLNMFRT